MSIDGFEIAAKIIHRGRGEFEILEDNYRGKYIGELVDASDVIRCKVEDDDTLKPKLTVRDYSRCDSVSILPNKHCTKCYELIREQIKRNEDLKLKVMEEKHKQDIEAIRQEMNMQFSQIMSIIQKNYKMAHMLPPGVFFDDDGEETENKKSASITAVGETIDCCCTT